MNYVTRFDDDRGSEESYADVGDSLGHSMLDNSILNYDDENRGPRNPSARAASTPGLDAMALREISRESDVDGAALACSSQSARAPVPSSQDNPLRGSQTDLGEETDFHIFEDENYRPAIRGADIATASPNIERPEGSFRIFQDTLDEDKKPASVTVYRETDDENDCDSIAGPFAQGDTATFSLLRDVAGVDESYQSVDESQRRPSSIGVSEQGDTATLSIFGDVFQDHRETRDHSPAPYATSTAATGVGFSIFLDEEAGNSRVS
jgi:hypothetical protein